MRRRKSVRRIVTVSPDVSSSTNLGGWVNKVGVWSHTERADWFADDAETILHWRERPGGQHIELGIAEVNLVGAARRTRRDLEPVRASHCCRSASCTTRSSSARSSRGRSASTPVGSRSWSARPSGVSLAPEGGAHQSIKTPSIGLEQPDCVYYEPAFALGRRMGAARRARRRLGKPDGQSAYLRLSTRPVDQALAAVPSDPAARERRRRNVVSGGYALRRADAPALTICAMGALVPEALQAAERLASLGFAAEVVCVTSPDLLFRAVQARRGLASAPDWILDVLLPADRAAPMVTVLDGHPHTLAFLAGVNRVPAAHLGVTSFGQSGDLDSVYRYHHIDTDSDRRRRARPHRLNNAQCARCSGRGRAWRAWCRARAAALP